MKIRVTLKDPDVFSECVDHAIRKTIDHEYETADDDEREAVTDLRTEKVWRVLKQWVEHQEYITIEFDTDAGTAVVVKRS